MIALVMGSVGGAIAAKAITGGQVKNNSLSGADIKDGSLKGADIKKATVAADRLTDEARASLRGADGAQGPAGPQGQIGPAGPSNAYSTFRNENFDLAENTSFQTVLTLAIPQPGSYVVFGKLEVDNDNNAPKRPTCRVTAGADSDSGRVGLGSANADDAQTVTYTVVTTLPAAGTAELACQKANAVDAIGVAERKITAIRVGSLVNTPASGP